MKFRDYLPNSAAPWLQGPKGTAWNRAVGDVCDSVEDRVRAAVLARCPSRAMADAVLLAAAERGIERGAAESISSLAARVVKAWETWGWAGTPYGILSELRRVGYSTPRIMSVRGKAHSLDSAGELVEVDLPPGSWAIDATQDFWSKFQVLFPMGPSYRVVDLVVDYGDPFEVGGLISGAHDVVFDAGGDGPLGAVAVDLSIDGINLGPVPIPATGRVALDDVPGAPATGIVVRFLADVVGGNRWTFSTELTYLRHPWASPGGATAEANAGDMVLVPGGQPDGEHSVTLLCSTGGALGSALVEAFVDGTPIPAQPVPAHGAVELPHGIVAQFYGSAMVPGDMWSFDSGVFPAQDSETVEQIRRIVRRWKPTHATCAGIVVQTSGWLWGWPLEHWAERGAWGGGAAVVWSL